MDVMVYCVTAHIQDFPPIFSFRVVLTIGFFFFVNYDFYSHFYNSVFDLPEFVSLLFQEIKSNGNASHYNTLKFLIMWID